MKFDVFMKNKKNKKVGSGESNDSAIKRLKNVPYGFTAATLLSLNIVLSLLSGCSSDEKVDEPDIQTESLVDENIIDDNKSTFYKIDQDDGVVLFVNDNYLERHNYVPYETVESRDEFIEGFYQKCQEEFIAKYPDIDFSEFINAYKEYKVILQQYYSMNKDAFMPARFVSKTGDKIIKMIVKFPLSYGYSAPVIPYEEYQDIINKKNTDKKTVEIIVREGETVSGIAHKMADSNTQYNQIIEQFAIDNDVADINKIKAGKPYKFAYFGEEDKTALDLTNEMRPIEELHLRMEYVRLYKNNVMILDGDTESSDTNVDLQNLIDDCIRDYEEVKFDTKMNDKCDALLNNLRRATDLIELLTGDRFEAPLRPIGEPAYKVKNK